MGSEAALWPLAASEAARLTGGDLAGDPEARAERVLVDSRAGVRPGDLFVGLVGPHFDGGRFARQALAEGASIALAGREHSLEEPAPGQAVITVEDPLAALQVLAAEARRRFAGRVVAITGSHGKTTVKDMLAAVLAGEHRMTASPMSFNSQVGVALALLQLDPTAELALVECGISLPGEMERLAAMVRPDCGVLTAIGDAHLAGLGSREVTAREKARLFAGLGSEPAPGGWVVTGAAEHLARAALETAGARVITVGGPGSDIVLETVDGRPRLSSGDLEVALDLGEAAPHWLDDAALAAAAALLLGASPASVEAGLAGWQPAPMRLEISTTPRGIVLINDAYTADPATMEAALLALVKERSPKERRLGAAVAVLGGMAQLGRARAAAHARAGRRVAELGIDRLIGVGEGGAAIAAAAREAGMPAERIHAVSDPGEAAMVLEERCRPGDRVLLKASRPARLEQVAALLFDSVSPARLFIDLDALVGNYHRIRRAVGRGRAVMAVVKSWGYGLDAVRVAKALERAGIDYFAVAYPDEGVALRDRGITTPILVQNVLPQEVDKVARHGLTAQVSSIEQAGLVAAEAERQRRAVRVHLKVDTGMGRSGAAPGRVVELARAIAASPWLTLEGLMTHFASADEPADDAFTREQIRQFDEVRAALAAAGFSFRFEHAAASAAVARFPEAHYSLVRCGLALFGYLTVPGPVSLGQQPVLRLTTQVVSVKELPAGHSVGYGRTFSTPGSPRTLALVALGYSDGYPWALSNRGWMLVGGKRCPVVGRVSMDVTTLDVTELGGAVRPGDEVMVFGPDPGEPSLVELAALAGTIPYELLTRISPRVRRIFRSSH